MKSITAYVSIPKSRKKLRQDDFEFMRVSRKSFVSEGRWAVSAVGEDTVVYDSRIERIVRVKITMEDD